MKRTIVTIVILLVTLLCVAQKNDKRNLLPPSFKNGTTTEVDHISVYPPSAQLIAEEIEETADETPDEVTSADEDTSGEGSEE